MEIIFFVLVLAYSSVSASFLFAYDSYAPSFNNIIAYMSIDPRDIPRRQEMINAIESVLYFGYDSTGCRRFKIFGIIESVLTFIVLIFSFVFTGWWGILFLLEAVLIYFLIQRKPLYTFYVSGFFMSIAKEEPEDAREDPKFEHIEGWSEFVDFFPGELRQLERIKTNEGYLFVGGVGLGILAVLGALLFILGR